MTRPRLTIRTLRKLYTNGQALLQARQYEAAIDVFRRVADAGVRDPRTAELATSATSGSPVANPAINPLYVKASLGLSFCCVEQGKLDEAISTLQGGMTVEPDNVEALCELGYIYRLRGMRDSSLEAFRHAVGTHPDCAKAHNELGYYYLQ